MFGNSVQSSSVDAVSVTVQWDPPTDNGGRDDLTYTVTVSPPTQLSATVITSTSVTVTAQYNGEYTVSIVTTNCAGNSTTGQYSFTIRELIESVSKYSIKYISVICGAFFLLFFFFCPF